MLALENVLPVLLVWWTRKSWKAYTRDLASRRPQLAAVCAAPASAAGAAAAGGDGGFTPSAPVTQLRQALWEGQAYPYDTFWDMYDLVLYTGYASVMPLVQPLTPILFWLNNLLEVRTDIAKIGTYQRPVPETRRDLGEWEKCLWFQLHAAVLQVSLFTVFSTQALELGIFTDKSDPYYYVDGKLNVSVTTPRPLHAETRPTHHTPPSRRTRHAAHTATDEALGRLCALGGSRDRDQHHRRRALRAAAGRRPGARARQSQRGARELARLWQTLNYDN